MTTLAEFNGGIFSFNGVVKVASNPKCDHFGKLKYFTIARYTTLIFVLKIIFEEILFLWEVMDKIVFSSLIAVNEMLTSRCDNLSTHCYHLTYHPYFDTQFRLGQGWPDHTTLHSHCCHVFEKIAFEQTDWWGIAGFAGVAFDCDTLPK